MGECNFKRRWLRDADNLPRFQGSASVNISATLEGGTQVSQTLEPQLGKGNADILQHITFNGSTGASLAVQIAPGTRSNGPTQYEKNHGINCFNGHGAVDIDDKPIVNLTVAGCIERCDADAECSAVVYRQDQQW